MSETNYFKHPQYVLLRLAERRLLPMSDKIYLKMRYKEVFGKELDLKNPQTFNEKLQWLKLYDRNPEYIKMVDKYEAKKYVADKIGEEYIIPTIGVYDSFDEIDFDRLPKQFVLKCTHDSGGLVICRNKEKFDKDKVKKVITEHLKRNYFYSEREWPYKDIKPRIMAEKYMSDGNEEGLLDYKFYCFNSKPEFLYVSEGLDNHDTAKIGFFDKNFNMCEFGRNDYLKFAKLPKKPNNFNKMLKIARKLAEGLDFLRVDLYEIDGKVYFGELTFTPNAGLMKFDPPEWDEKVGKMLKLRTKSSEEQLL